MILFMFHIFLNTIKKIILNFRSYSLPGCFLGICVILLLACCKTVVIAIVPISSLNIRTDKGLKILPVLVEAVEFYICLYLNLLQNILIKTFCTLSLSLSSVVRWKLFIWKFQDNNLEMEMYDNYFQIKTFLTILIYGNELTVFRFQLTCESFILILLYLYN